jgi:hypothetical protein
VTGVAIALAAVLALAAVAFVARSFARSHAGGADDLRLLDPAAQARIELLEERHRLLSALQELEFDHRTGKVADDDYRQQAVVLRREIASVLARLDEDEAQDA